MWVAMVRTDTDNHLDELLSIEWTSWGVSLTGGPLWASRGVSTSVGPLLASGGLSQTVGITTLMCASYRCEVGER